MIKLWKGIEKEGIGSEAAIMTLFICSDKPVESSTIFDVLQKYPDIKGLYFGAGRKEFAGCSVRDWDKIIQYCDKNQLSIVIEVSPLMLDVFVNLYNAPSVTFVVAYYNAPRFINRLYFKTDDFITTKIYTSQAEVDITEVVSNMYPDDIVIYEGEN